MNSEYPRPGGLCLPAITITTGAVLPPVAKAGITLAATTYFLVLPSGRSDLTSVHLKWDAATAATFTVETCNLPEFDADNSEESDRTDISSYSTTAGDWIQENPSTAIVAVTGSGNTSTAATIVAGGSAAGGCMFHLGNLGSRRLRIKAVVTTGGVVRCAVWGKGA